jgi:hypothetical protein
MAEANLRPMTLGEVLDTTFSLYKRNFWLFAGITALPFLLILIFQLLAAAAGITGPRTNQTPTVSLSNLAGAMAGGAIVLILYFLMVGYAHAATVFAVSDLYLARTATVRGAFARVGAKAFRVLLIFFLIFLAVFVAIFVFAIVAGIVGAIFGSPLIIWPLIILAFIPALIFFCRTAVAIPTAMLEDTGAVSSLQRSMHLTRGYGLQVFLIYLLVGFLTYAGIIVFQLPFLSLATKAAASHQALSFGIVVLQHLASFISQVLIGPIATIAMSLMYYNLRVRKEAFDIQHLMSSLGASPSPSAPAAM